MNASVQENIYQRYSTKPQKRVVVTGVEAITPLGLDLSSSWDALLRGCSGIDTITLFDISTHEVKIAGEVKKFNPDAYVDKKEQKRLERFVLLSLVAARRALDHSGLEITERNTNRIGTVIGSGIGGLPFIEKQLQTLFEKGPSRMSPFFIPTILTNMAAGCVSINLGIKGPNYAITSACASGTHAIGESYNAIRFGVVDAMVCGGTEAVVCSSAVGGFASMKALSTRNNQPKSASRPFDADRDGFVLSEGAGIFILESYEHAAKRGAPILAELRGYGTSADAFHMTNPSPNGVGASMAMAAALDDAQLNPEDIKYINAHGTGTPAGDIAETQAIHRLFGAHKTVPKDLWISSSKSMIGHTLGAAGAIEGAFCIQSLLYDAIHPTINLDKPGDGCDLDYVPMTARERRVNHIMNNSFGFGGTNACLIFSRI